MGHTLDPRKALRHCGLSLVIFRKDLLYGHLQVRQQRSRLRPLEKKVAVQRLKQIGAIDEVAGVDQLVFQVAAELAVMVAPESLGGCLRALK